MNLHLENKLFIVGGATSGLGHAVLKGLITEGAQVIAIARGKEKINKLESDYPNQVEGVVGDITQSETISKIINQLEGRNLSGVLINAGGPPAMSFMETKMEDWDKAYQSVLRWKIELTKQLLPVFLKQEYGRLLYLESVSVKQPVKNLVLSNSLRLGVVGFVKTLSQEVASKGITLNIIGPGYHATPRIESLLKRISEQQNNSIEEARAIFEKQTDVGSIGEPEDFASLAIWLLSPLSRYITGKTFTVDGGLVKGSFG